MHRDPWIPSEDRTKVFRLFGCSKPGGLADPLPVVGTTGTWHLGSAKPEGLAQPWGSMVDEGCFNPWCVGPLGLGQIRGP